MSEVDKLRSAIRRICEELGKQKVRMFKGGGTSQPYYRMSTKESLGEPGRWDPKAKGVEKSKKVKKDITVSRAFIKDEEEDIGNEVDQGAS